MTKWVKDSSNGNRYSFEYVQHLMDICDDQDMVYGVHLDNAIEHLNSLFFVLSMLGVIWAYDSGEGEPTIWIKL